MIYATLRALRSNAALPVCSLDAATNSRQTTNGEPQTKTETGHKTRRDGARRGGGKQQETRQSGGGAAQQADKTDTRRRGKRTT